jgi:hypothetical protein
MAAGQDGLECAEGSLWRRIRMLDAKGDSVISSLSWHFVSGKVVESVAFI